MDSYIVLVGLNHVASGESAYDRFALDTQSCRDFWAGSRSEDVFESIVITTNSRIEIIACGNEACEKELLRAWAAPEVYGLTILDRPSTRTSKKEQCVIGLLWQQALIHQSQKSSISADK